MSSLMLTSRRLRFETWDADDYDDLYRLHADPRVQTSYGPDPDKWTHDAIAQRLRTYRSDQEERGFTKWKLCLTDGTFIGRAGWSPWNDGELELGYALVPEVWGRGYGREAAETLLRWAAGQRLTWRLVGFALTHNAASRRILAGIGMDFVDYRIIGGVENAFYRYP